FGICRFHQAFRHLPSVIVHRSSRKQSWKEIFMTRWFQISPNVIRGKGEAESPPRWVCGCLLMAIGLLAVGCDSASFAPARPAELGGTGSEAAPVPSASPVPMRTSKSLTSGIKPIELIAGPRLPEDSETLKASARI